MKKVEKELEEENLIVEVYKLGANEEKYEEIDKQLVDIIKMVLKSENNHREKRGSAYYTKETALVEKKTQFFADTATI